MNITTAMNRRLIVAAAWLLAAIPTWLYALPAEFSADYHLEMYQTSVARATYTLKHTADGLSMTQTTTATGLVALLRKDRIDVRSDMTLNNGEPALKHYSYIHSGIDEDRNVELRIDRRRLDTGETSLHVSGAHRGDPVDISTKLEFWDPLSIQVPLMMQAADFGAPHDFSVFMSGEIRTYLFSNPGDEQVSVDGRVYDCVKIVGKDNGRDRSMIIWLARGLHFLPVKIQQVKDGSVSSTLLLDRANFPNDSASRVDTVNDADYE